METMVINSSIVHGILSREIPKLFSDKGNYEYETDKPRIVFLDCNGEEEDHAIDFEIHLKKREI